MKSVLFYDKKRIDVEVVNSINITEAVEKDINFYDYDGFRLLSYTNAEALALAVLPDNLIINENLTFDGWNWTLQEIKDQINNVGGVVNVGAIYHTTDEKTHITCKPTETYPYASICLTPTVSNAVTVDWGDGNTDTWESTSQETKSHTYTGVTDSSVYDITISCSSGTYSFNNCITGSQENNQNCVYTDIKLSNKVTSLGSSCFYRCYPLQSITIPSSVTSLGGGCFSQCSSLQSITIPNSVTSLGSDCFYGCYSLRSITIPNSFTSLGGSFKYCYSLQSITIPSTVTSLGSDCFHGCSSLQSVTIPSGVTSLDDSYFLNCFSLQSITIPSTVTSLGDSCFYQCYSLQSINIPNGVTSLNSGCFQYCYSLILIYMKSETPPILASTTSISNNINLVIYVPRGTLTAYQSASNWSSYASKMIEYNY